MNVFEPSEELVHEGLDVYVREGLGTLDYLGGESGSVAKVSRVWGLKAVSRTVKVSGVGFRV